MTRQQLRSESALPWSERALRPAAAKGSASFWCKRTVDVLFGALLVVALLPLLCIIAVLIKIDSPGPVLFVHERVGARRRMSEGGPVWVVAHFPMFKFRSMFEHADQTLHQAQVLAFVQGHLNLSGSAKIENDRRVTRVGRVLRRTSFDELPQLFNVLRGEMSLVGPRPVPPYEAAAYVAWQRERLAALPGITGLWQVTGRGVVTFDDMVRMDIEYVRTQSLWLDLEALACDHSGRRRGPGCGVEDRRRSMGRIAT